MNPDFNSLKSLRPEFLEIGPETVGIQYFKSLKFGLKFLYSLNPVCTRQAPKRVQWPLASNQFGSLRTRGNLLGDGRLG